jgi:hypothetical protein
VKLDARCGTDFDSSVKATNDPRVTGVRIRPRARDGKPTRLPPGTYRVVLEGDHILGAEPIEIPDPYDPTKKIRVQPALDGNHFAPGLPKRCPTGDRVEGGRFLSWFTMTAG